MSWMTPREQHFSLKGPFIAKRSGGAGNIELKDGKIYTAAQLAKAELSDRHIQRMYAAHWLDMAPEDATPVPLDRDGDGERGGSLTDIEQLALQRAGFTVDDFLALPDDIRASTLAEAVADHAEEAAKAAAERSGEPSGSTDSQSDEKAPDEPETGSGAEVEPEAGAATGAEQGEDGAAADQGGSATAPSDTVVAGYKHFGFGKYFAINAAGEQLGEKLGKVDATGRAARDAVPLIAQDGSPLTEG